MCPIVRQALLLSMAVLAIAGCRGSGSRQPEDPLFISKKPIEAKASYGPPARSAQLEQLVPPFAEMALTARAVSWEPTPVLAAAH